MLGHMLGDHLKRPSSAYRGWLWRRIRDKDRKCGCKLEEISVQELAAAKLLQFGLYGPPADPLTHEEMNILKIIVYLFSSLSFLFALFSLLCNDGNGLVAQQLARLELIE